MGTSVFRTFVSLLAIGSAILITGCAQNAPYHTLPGEPGNCRQSPTADECVRAYYQEYESFDLAFAEYSDRGNAFSDRFIGDVLERIEQRADNEGVVLVTFIHGWKHNANEGDPNLIDFKRALQSVQDILQTDFDGTDLGRRRLVGLYIGWRGASLDVPILNNSTFWDRKAVAEEVGDGGVSRLLLELDEITRDPDQNVMVVIGHSFGGAIVVSALNDVLTERTVQRTRGRGYARTIGDGVLVLNPAIEANQTLSFVEAAIKADFHPEQYPLFVSLSTDADQATHYAFPAGQTLGLLFTWQQEDLERSYYYDRLEPDKEKALREEHLDTTTVGNFAPFLTHRLTARTEGDETVFEVKTCDSDPQGCVPRGLTTLGGQPAIRKLPKNYPLFFYKTDASVMEGHNDIFNQRVRAFVVTIIDDVVRRALARVDAKAVERPLVAPPALLEDSKAFEQRMEQILRYMPDDPEG